MAIGENRPMHVSSVGNSRIKLWRFRKNPGESLAGSAFIRTDPKLDECIGLLASIEAQPGDWQKQPTYR
jgi:hypothetical protein